jgi:flagellar basal-body rod modification protein FlgD
VSTSTSPVSSSLADIAAAAPSSGTSSSSNDTLGQDAFLKLLTTQMQNQDPLNPVDNTQMLAQLAQFSQLSVIQGLSSKFDSMATALAGSTSLAATQLVGKEVSFDASQLSLAAGSSAQFNVVLPQAATDTTVVISDSSGRVVRTLHLGAQQAGTTAIPWDGLDDSGHACAAGTYTLGVGGTASDGTQFKGLANIRAKVTGVSYATGTPTLVVGDQRVALSQVTDVYDPTSSS